MTRHRTVPRGLLLLYGLLGSPQAVAAQFITPLPNADSLTVADRFRLIRALHREGADTLLMIDADSTRLTGPLASARPRWFFPMFVGGHLLAKEIYSSVGYGVLGSLDTSLSESQALTTVEIIAGAVGVLPFGIRTAFVVSKNDTATVMGDGGPHLVEGTIADVTALLRNGGNLAGRLALPLFLTKGPNVRSSLSLAIEAGALGDLTEPDSLRGSGSIGLNLGIGLSVRELTSDRFLGDFLIPVRLGWIGTTGNLEPGLIDRKGFGFLQIGVGLTDEQGQFRIAVLWSRPFAPEVRAHAPRFLVNLSAALAR